ncbi:MAG TPA: putative porin [Leadbetterella sp.]|nr:putative porin [Leadbetterella sp.]
MRFFTICTILFFTGLNAFAQILDDSTKQIYGPKTVKYRLEKDILKNFDTQYSLDTLLQGFYKTDIVNERNWLYQDLGNIGTSSKSILFEEQTDPSTKLGLNTFGLYAPKTVDFRYYNTRSPYTNLSYMQGSFGHTKLDFTHSQNVHPRLNFTLNLSKYNSSKQIDATNSEQKLVDHWNYDLSTNYFSKNKKYSLLAAFYHFNHKQTEQGGILVNENLSIDMKDLKGNYRRFYDSQFTEGVYNTERWNNTHIYQQMVLKNGFQVFHTLDYEHQKHIYVDPNFAENSLQMSYNIDTTTLANDSLVQNFSFGVLSNKVGFKGRYRGFNYLLHARQRFYRLDNKLSETFATNLKSETFVGGSLGYYFKDSSNFLNADAEFSANLKNFLLNAKLSFKGLEGTFYQSVIPAGLFYDNFDNGILKWKNNFKGLSTTHINAAYNLRYKAIIFRPEVSNTLLGNYVYLDQNLNPVQTETIINITNLILNVGINKNRYKVSNQFILNIQNAKEIYKLPTLINFTNFEANFTYAKVLKIFVGADVFFKSKYTADAYSPLLNQFYLQDDFKVWGAATVDPYLSFQINKVRLAFKLIHANQGLPNQGFYTSPYYLALPRSFALKVDWPLFD